MWQQDEADDEAADEISHDNLKKREIGVVGQSRDADDGERAGFRSDDGKRNRPPGYVAAGEEIIAQGALALAESQAEQSDPDKIGGDDRVVEMVQAHALCTSLTRLECDP